MKYMKMTSAERRFHDVSRQVCLPQIQAEIIDDLNAEERALLESGTEEDVEKMRQIAKRREEPFFERESNLEWLVGNGIKNISRLADFRGIPPRKLALDFALEHSLLHGITERDRLVRKCVGEDTRCSTAAIKFIDNELLVNGKVVCTVRPTRVSKLDHILRSFDESNWRVRKIHFKKFNRKQITDAVRQLNSKQNAIKFSPSLCSIKWEMATPHDDED